MNVSLAGYRSFLLSIGIPPANAAAVFPSVLGTVSAGTVSTLTDISANWAVDQWSGCVLFDVTQAWGGVVISNTPTVVSFITSAGGVELIDSSGGFVTDSSGNDISATGNTSGVAPQPGDQYLIVQPVVSGSLCIALETVNEALEVSSSLYNLAVYNLAADRLLNYAPDQPGQNFFAKAREKYHLLDTSVGVIQGASDQGTSGSYLNLEAMRNFTLGDLQTLKTPFGRRYMDIAMAYGPSIWGLS
jgi:hypothetical protein